MVQINTVTPPRFRPGDRVTISGFSFSPAFGDNQVRIGGSVASIFSESETDLVVDVPGGITQNEYVAVQVQRIDTLENDAISSFCKAPLSDLQDGSIRVPGQVPGPIEALVLTLKQPDAPQAQDFERMAMLAEFILFEVLTTAGDLFAHQAGGRMLRFAVGAAGTFLKAAPAAAEGLAWGTRSPRLTLTWGKEFNSDPGVGNGPMVAGGDSSSQSLVLGDHGAGQAGTIDQLIVLVQFIAAGDTLDQVQIFKNGVSAYDSGTGLGLGTVGEFHQANPAIAVVATDRLEVRAFKTGLNDVMRIKAKVGIQ